MSASCASHAEPGGRRPTSSVANPSCSSASLYSDREACYAGWAPETCSQSRECASYREMHLSETRLREVERRVIELATTQYASYLESDPTYVEDLTRSFISGTSAWRRYRDAHCEAEPLLQGMGRGEVGNLTEACRLELTKARINQIEVLLKAF